MGEPALKLDYVNPDRDDNRDLKTRIYDTHTEEIIIGLCGPIGTDIHYCAEEIARIIKEKYNYNPIIIKLSDFIKNRFAIDDSSLKKFDYYNELISKGNELRTVNGPNVLAELAINEIAVHREILKRESPKDEFESHRTCFIIDSIKNNEELELFRLIYTNLFYFIGVFSNLEVRVKNLEKKNIHLSDIYKLVDRDSGEELQAGQQVGNTFVQADFFLRIDESTSAQIAYRIERYLNLIFGSEIITPNVNETAMYQAFAAAGNSACLSRQVGASITNIKGDILGLGWNDVPKAKGGVYTYSDSDPLAGTDHRCLNKQGGVCFNDTEKELIRTQLLDDLVSSGVVSTNDKLKALSVIKKSRIKELIEFSRAVHAEMLAIISASQKSGLEVVGGKLYCTTYPCHNCARHIVAAGIEEVYYIEPYRKSLALKLHDDAITESEGDTKKVRILMFDGVAPRRYLEFFKMTTPRKENGKKKIQDKSGIQPKNTISLQAIPLLEREIIKELQSKKLITIAVDEEETDT